MPTNLRRMTITITPEMEEPLDSLKQELFYNCTKSEMLRELIIAGVQTIKEEKKVEKCLSR